MSAAPDDLLASLELVAERCDDLVPLVYQRLFTARPDLREFFALSAGVRPRTGMGNMVNEILRILVSDESGFDLHNEAQAAIVFHTGWGLGKDTYREVIDAVVAVVREVCAEEWPRVADAWHGRVALVTQALGKNWDAIEGSR